MFRSVVLPEAIKGRLYLHSMPGRYEPYEATREAIRMKGIAQVVCLTSLDEIAGKSPDYARALQRNAIPWQQIMFPIVDFGVPADLDKFWELIQSISAALRAGENVLVHCAAGIGRTGTVASCVLTALGMTPEAASAQVQAAGSYAERPEQVALIRWAAAQEALQPD